jgi:ligand-binding sensor domain-containing protein
MLSLALSRFFRQDPVAFVGTDGEGLYRTRDGCESFHPLKIPAQRIYSLYWWKSSLFACTEDGLYLSQDAGESWESVVKELKGIRVHSIWIPAPDAQSEIFLGTDRGVFMSPDGGLSWRHLTRGMLPAAVLGFGSFPIQTADEDQRQRK